MPSIAVYSCFFGDPEPFNPASMGTGHGYDRIVFTDRRDIAPEGVEMRLCQSTALGPAHESRRAKLLPHRELSGYEWAIYVDNRASLTKDPKDIVADIGSSARPGRYVYQHPERSSVFDELDVCFLIGHIDEVQWRLLDSLYRHSALPDDLNLTHNAVLLYKAGDNETERMSEMWFEMFLRYCKRDQLTMQLAEHLSGVRASRLEEALSDIAKWPVFLPQERTGAVNPPKLFKPDGKLSYARWRFKKEKKYRETLIASQRAQR